MMQVRFPWARAELEEHLEYLVEPARFVDGDPNYCGVDYAMHFVLDDFVFGEDARASIGHVLLSNAEADAAKILADSMGEILRLYGKNKKDSVYVRAPEWARIAEAAERLLLVMRSNSPP